MISFTYEREALIEAVWVRVSYNIFEHFQIGSVR